MPVRSKFYFYLDGNLHFQLRVLRGKDLLVAWNYPEHKKVTYNYTDVQRRKKKAWTTWEAGAFIDRSKQSVQLAITRGDIPPPQHSYSFETGRKKEYWWSEDDIMGLLDFFASLSKGRPRSDGELNTWDLPTPRELRALLNDEEVLYVKQGDQFVPTWKAK